MTLASILKRLIPAAMLCAALDTALTRLCAQGTAFTYQGRLNDSGEPANGLYDLTFALFGDATTTTAATGTLTNHATAVTNGLFTVILDFSTVDMGTTFSGAARWLQVGVRTNGAAAFTTLEPRQELTPTPYAVYAGSANAAGLLGALPASGLSGAYPGALTLSNPSNVLAGKGAGLTALTATNLVGTVPDARLSTNIALRAGGNTFTGNQTVNGAVGIGTPVGNYALDILYGGGPFGARIAATPASGGYTTLTLDAPDNDAIIWFANSTRVKWSLGNNHASDNFQLMDGSDNTRLWVTHANGNVGIGTTTPAALLEVAGASQIDGTFLANGNATFNTNATFSGQLRLNSDLGFSQSSRGAFAVDAPNVPGGRFVVQTNGFVGIGAPAPAGPLSVQTASGMVSIVSDNPYTPTLAITGGGAPGVLRLRNALEVWPDTNATAAGRLDVRDTSGNAQITLDGSSGDVTVQGELTAFGAVTARGEMTATAINLTSDRNAKEQFKPVDVREVLAKVARLPITEWQYKTQADARHIGPMAQDFHDAFALGRDDKHITSVDADGVALAAIQGLNEEIRERDARIRALENSVEELKTMVSRLAKGANGGAR